MSKSTPRRLRLESLEDRSVPAVFGNPWPDASHLTLSFAPDGAAVGPGASSLFGTLGATMPTAAWQGEILRAFQTWAVNANVNIGLVADGGQPFGAGGPVEGDPRFGDVRIAAVPLAGEVAVGTPFDATAGSRAGDVWLNSQAPFGIGSSSAYDLYTVALHEAGHVFGIDENTDPSSAMYQTYTGPRTGINSGDVTALQGLYGARKADAFDLAKPNDTLKDATQLNVTGSSDSPTSVTADLTTLADVDYYKIKVDATDGAVTVRVSAAGLSLLTPRMTVFDDSGKVVGTVTATGPGTGELQFQLPAASVETTYYVKVDAATKDVFGIGGYRLSLNAATAVAAPGNSLIDPEVGTNDTLGTATDLRQQYAMSDARFDYATRSSLGGPADVDFFHVRAPQSSTGSAGALTVMVWAADASGIDPVVTVYDVKGNLLPAQVLAHEDGTYTVQVANTVANADYYVSVRSGHPAPGSGAGNYFLGVDFGGVAAPVQTFASGTLSADSPAATTTLNVAEGQVFHFILSAGAGNPSAAVRMTVYDAAGNVVLSRITVGGDATSVSVFLAPGAYTFLFAGGTRDGSPLSPLNFTLQGLGVTDPIGPTPTDTTTLPAGTTTTTTTATTITTTDTTITAVITNTTGTTTTTSTMTSVWSPITYTTAVSPTDPYSSPWWFGTTPVATDPTTAVLGTAYTWQYYGY